MTLQLRRTDDARWGYLDRLDTYDLVEMIERDFHQYHAGPMEMCPDEDCTRWYDALRKWRVIG